MFKVICSECGTMFQTESHSVAKIGLCTAHEINDIDYEKYKHI